MQIPKEKIMRIWFLLTICLAISAASGNVFADGTKKSSKAKNVLLFVADDLGTTLGCYGDSVAVTPNFDALAKSGTRFTNAFATTASCSASRSVILSGLHNHLNGQYGHQHHFHKFASYHDIISLTLPTVLAQHGYRTARIGKFHVAPEKVYHFETKIRSNQRNPVLMAENCRDFLNSKDPDKPFLLYFAPADPHRSGAVNRRSESELKPNLFGNKPNRGKHFEIEEVFYESSKVPVPNFLPDTVETREELAQYYQSVSRLDQGLGRLVAILKELKLYEDTLIIATSDHGVAFAGAKTNVYDAGLNVPLIVRNPLEEKTGVTNSALVSHVDITPSVLEFAGCLDSDRNGPTNWVNPNKYWQQRNEDFEDNRAGGNVFRSYQGKSWLGILNGKSEQHHSEILASHTFHEIQMYYPMRAIRDSQYKLIWNIAHKLDFPFATDLWEASSWQAQYQAGPKAVYGQRDVLSYIKRPEFELFDIRNDPTESNNLASQPGFLSILDDYKKRLRELQREMKDPWESKWDYQ